VSNDDPRIPAALHDATEARKLAYAPYSRFKMGAAVVTDTNKVIRGTLVENVSLGLAMCAERNALFSCVAQQAGKPEVLALVAPKTAGALTWPCGACLQVAMELGGPALLVVVSDGKETRQAELSELAPRLPNKP
jgi:cytidine deaminase